MNYGLIGYPLKHSFSKEIHSKIANYDYEICELDEKSFDAFMRKKDFIGINVTIPYKQKVIPYLDRIDSSAKEINAVNTIINRDGKLIGYNTDILGVMATFNYYNVNTDNKNILILGTGATSNTIHHAIHSNNILKAYRQDSRIKGDILYSDLDRISNDIQIIINTTPNGMFPHICDNNLIDISKFKNVEVVFDVIYNPLRSRLLLEAEKFNIKTISGLYMLIAQGYFASQIFTNKDQSFNVKDISTLLTENTKMCSKIYKQILHDKLNIILIGMPTCGKSTLGKMLSERLNYNFLDTDTIIEQKISMKISDYIKLHGEKNFRTIESDIIKDVSSVNHSVISTGGGSILNHENVLNLKSNGKVFFINRSLDLLKPSPDRPLTCDIESLTKKYNERLPLYKDASDVEINGDLEFDEKINEILNKL